MYKGAMASAMASAAPATGPKTILKHRSSQEETQPTEKKARITKVSFDDVAVDMETGDQVLPSTRSMAEYYEAVASRKGGGLIQKFRAIEAAMKAEEVTAPDETDEKDTKDSSMQGWEVVMYQREESESESESEDDDEIDEELEEEPDIDTGGIDIIFGDDEVDDDVEKVENQSQIDASDDDNSSEDNSSDDDSSSDDGSSSDDDDAADDITNDTTDDSADDIANDIINDIIKDVVGFPSKDEVAEQA
ncbi:hypothetical protein F4819DRAFT_2842 [Hypoxylon fuscum]|nr:hypothetical protein F4819DRAFT_2842 [Hypoxylon fuscum]